MDPTNSPVDADQKQRSTSPPEEIFKKAIDITVAAKKAREQALYSREKVRIIEQLAKNARDEYEKLNDVARSLASTATSVAAVALQVCEFGSYEEAFVSRKDYSRDINLDTFLAIVHNPDPQNLEVDGSTENTLHEDVVNDQHGLLHNRLFLRQDNYRRSSSADSSHTDPSSREYFVDRDIDLIGKPGRIQYGKGLQQPTAHRNGVMAQYMDFANTKSKTAPNAIPKYLSSSSSSSSSAYEGTSPSSSVEKFFERFPRPVNPDEHRDTSSVGTFHDSHTSMTPLWEDRYCHLAGEDGCQRALQSASTGKETWSEKKSRKQFQMKLQHVSCDLSSSGMETCDEGSTSSLVQRSPGGSENPLPRRLVPLDGCLRRKPESPEANQDSEDRQADRDSADRCHAPPLLMYTEDYEAEDEGMSSDNEVETFLKEQTRAGRLRAMEHTHTAGQRLMAGTKEAQLIRPVSPLLNDEERGNYGVSAGRGAPSPSTTGADKQVFQHRKSPRNDD